MGSLASPAYGQHRNVVLVNANTLLHAKYLLKTKLGVSENFYAHTSLTPVFGSGQGAGNSPGIWCAISSVLFETYEAKSNGAEFLSPHCKTKMKLFMTTKLSANRSATKTKS